jgi:methylmalonyl-CoA mutase
MITDKPISRHPIRIVTAASLFDGHDASINIIRRLLQDFGAEVIHLGHNRSVMDVAKAVLQEGAQGVCVSSYQGGHMEYFKYLRDLLVKSGAQDCRIFGGGGGVIVYEEKAELEKYGIAQIFHPDDGRRLGLEGMIRMIIDACDYDITQVRSHSLGVAITQLENNLSQASFGKTQRPDGALVLGITGTGGAGKSSLVDELVQRFLNAYPDKKIAVVCVDPSKKKTGGSLLGDRIRMNSLSSDRVFMRSLASRGSGKEISDSLPAVVEFLRKQDFSLVIAETSGIGQGNMAITEVCDIPLYVMTSEFGSQSQLEKIDMIDFAHFVAINKSDRRGALDALRDVSKQFRRSRKIFDHQVPVPVFLTQASRFNDAGVNKLFAALVRNLAELRPQTWTVPEPYLQTMLSADEHVIIPPERQNYLSEIVASVRGYKAQVREQAKELSLFGALELVAKQHPKLDMQEALVAAKKRLQEKDISPESFSQVQNYGELLQRYSGDFLQFQVRGKTIEQKLVRSSLSGTKIRRVVVPKLSDWGDRHVYLKLENVPGEFPYTAGVFPLKREDEDPKRMFAGEGTPTRTNRRFHFLCKGEKAQPL